MLLEGFEKGRQYWVEQTWKILEDAGLERPEGRWKGTESSKCKGAHLQGVFKGWGGGWLDSSQSVPAAIAKYQRLYGL